MAKFCYSPQKGIDDVIASKMNIVSNNKDNSDEKNNRFNPFIVATLRGMYDETHQNTPLNIENLNDATLKLAEFRREIAIANRAKINSIGTTIAPSYRSLKKAFTAEERFNRVNMLSSMFSIVVDEIQKKNPHLSRKAIVEGYEENGHRKCGEFLILEKVYDQLTQLQAVFKAKNDEEKADKINQVLSNWAALTTFTRMKLRDTEGVKLGNKLEFAVDADETSYSDNNLSKLFDPSESVRDSWQTSNGLESAFGSVGKQVRKLISTLPDMEVVDVTLPDGRVAQRAQPKRDDLNFVKMLDPVRVHQTILNMMRGITSENQMMKVFISPKTGMPKAPWMGPIIEALNNNPQLRAQFYTDFKKNFQPYSIIIEAKELISKGFKIFNTKVLNAKEDLLGGQFLARIILGKPLNEENSVYDNKGNVNFKNLKATIESINEWLKNDSDSLILGKNKFYTRGGSSIERRNFLYNALESLGIDIDTDTLSQIMTNSKDLRNLTNALKDLAQYAVTNSIYKQLESGEKISYKKLIKNKTSKEKESKFQEKVRKIHEVITKNREGLRLENRVRYKDAKGNNITLYSQVNPSYMGDKFDEIQSYVNANDKEGLKTYLTNEYLDSPFFYYQGKVLNKWIEELLKCCDTPANISLIDTFAGQFDYQRFLGTSDNSFENFTSKQHMIDMFTHYKSDSGGTALFPVFILGDSGVSKYIRAKKYSKEEIMDGLYNCYIQEKRRQALVRATNKYLDDKNYKRIENFSDSENTFSILTFLNKDYKSFDGKIGKYAEKLSENPTESEVRNAISTYLDDSLINFKKKFEDLGLLKTFKGYVKEGDKTKEVTKYTYLGESVTEENLDETLADFYNNVKFATINQLQLMTIDTSFYKGTKDLQKRYKEVHAPGSVLDVSAIDKNGNKYSEDGIERCVYFDDVNINAEETNKEFMEAIAAVHGKNSDIYNKYKKNTLTDGQGYRTLESYRKVMGMAGKWTEEMQDVYESIKSLRERYGKEAIPSSELSKIAAKAVVFQPIKPYMFTHEKLPLNDTEKVIIPVQHKYAEAVLIPELLPKDSKLRDMAYWMDEHKVDLIGSTKIVKVGCFGSTNISEATDSNSLNEALNKACVHQLSYSDYRIQTNVPEHINSSQLFGTQLRKLIMANIKMDDDHYKSYIGGDGTVNLGGTHGKVNLNGRNLIAFYNSLIVSNILDSFDKFKGGISNVDEFSDKLIQNVINNSRESSDNILSYAVEDGDFAMPLFEGGLEHDAAAMAFSMFKKIVNKQQIKGGSAVQVSAMGIKGYEKDGDLKYVTDGKDNILYAECEMPFDISYIDSNGKEISLNFEDYCNEDGTLKTIKVKGEEIPLLEHRFPGSTDILAYRIPTERDYSMMNLKVKRFSHKTAGGTIKVPAQGTTIAGFDFDVDKLYFMRREYKMLKKQSTDSAIDNLLSDIFSDDTEKLVEFEEYDFNKPPRSYKDKNGKLIEGNSRAARNNMLITLIQQRLMDPETMKQRTTPGGFSNSSRAARIMRELLYGSTDNIKIGNNINWELINDRIDDENSVDPEPNYDPSDPMTIITYNQQNQVAGKLIGIFANQNTNHAFASLMKSFKVVRPIEFCGHSYGDGRESSFLKAPDGVDVDLNVAEFLAASVDAVKDPVLNFMNLNTLTADAGAVLARIGYTTTEIGLLFNQPVIKEVCEYSFNEEVSIDTAIRETIAKYKKQGVKIKGKNETTNTSNFSKDKLAKNILNDRYNKENSKNVMDINSFAEEQLDILSLFSEILSVANDVTNFVASTKFTASNAVGSTFGDLYAQQYKVKNYLTTIGTEASHVSMEVTEKLDSPILNDNSLLNMSSSDYLDTVLDSPFAYEQAMFDMNRKCLNLLNSYFPYQTNVYQDARDKLNELVNYGTLDADTINSIHSDMMVYLLSNQERSEFNGSLPKNTQHGIMTTREYYTKWFAKDLLNHLEVNPELRNMPIFKYMLASVKEVTDPTTREEIDKIDINIQGVGGLDSYVKDEIRESWAELAKDSKTSQIAIDLFLYNFYKLGFNFSYASFMNLAPTELKEIIQVPTIEGSRSYKEFLQDVQKGKFNIDKESFAAQYMLNHLDNKRFGLDAKTKTVLEILKPLAIENNIVNDEIEIDLSKIEKESNKYFIVRENNITKSKLFTPIIKLNVGNQQIIYIADSFDMTKSSVMKYHRVNKLGTKGYSLQYLGDNSLSDSTTDTETADSFEYGSTKVTPEKEPEVEEFDKEKAIAEIAEVYAEVYKRENIRDAETGELYTKNDFITIWSNPIVGTEEDIKKTVNLIRKTKKENGTLGLNEQGELTRIC